MVALVALIIFIGIANPIFLQPKSLFQLLSNSAFTGMLAVGMVFVIVIRDIDLSVGWMFNFSAVIAGKLMIAGRRSGPRSRCSASRSEGCSA